MAFKIGKVIKVLNPHQVVINLGKEDGLKIGDRYLIYVESEEIIDPDTGLSLGFLEVSRGTTCVSHVQPNMAVLSSDMPSQRQALVDDGCVPLFGSCVGDRVRFIDSHTLST